MKVVIIVAQVVFFFLLTLTAIQIVLLLYKNVGLVSFWVLVDYA